MVTFMLFFGLAVTNELDEINVTVVTCIFKRLVPVSFLILSGPIGLALLCSRVH